MTFISSSRLYAYLKVSIDDREQFQWLIKKLIQNAERLDLNIPDMKWLTDMLVKLAKLKEGQAL